MQTITYNHLINKNFSSWLAKLANMSKLPASEKRHLAVAILPTIEKEMSVYVKLEKEIFDQHEDGKDEQGKVKFKHITKLNRKLDELRGTVVEWFPRAIQLWPEIEKDLNATDLFALAPLIQRITQEVTTEENS